MKKLGDKFGRLTLIQKTGDGWICRCDCGTEKYVFRSNIGTTTNSCGCLRNEILKSLRGNPTHGMTNTPEHRAWVAMRQRCRDKRYHSYRNYGGRGISVCERWNRFENFFSDMGKRPSPRHSLDRIDNDANYTPENCKWSLPIEQTRNRRPRDRWDIGMRGSTMPGAKGAKYAIAMLSFGS